MGISERLRDLSLVKDETIKPEPTEYPPLLHTLQTHVGMVINNGLPQHRHPYIPPLQPASLEKVEEHASLLRSLLPSITSKDAVESAFVETNLKASSLPVGKNTLLEYIRHRKRIDVEQAVAMVIAFLTHSSPGAFTGENKAVDDFEDSSHSAIYELINDQGVVSIINQTCMWRESQAFLIPRNPREAAAIAKKNKILRMLGLQEEQDGPSNAEFVAMLQTLRRQREKLNHSQHLTMPAEFIDKDGDDEKQRWLPKNNYTVGQQKPISEPSVRLVPKSKFRKIQQLLHALQLPQERTSRYVFDVETFIQSSGLTSPRRMAALESSQDPYAIAYGFMAAQREQQLKVVSDHQWTRFLVKGEGAMILQNRPDVLTSFEDILVRHASDLRALTAIRCPKGLRDHFSAGNEILDRVRGVCELMERYVKDFGGGKMETLTFSRDSVRGSGRGPVDLYNALCDELRDCRARAYASRVDLNIGPVHKFLAKDIMACNNAWADDAFAGGKVPGWVGYLARLRGEEVNLAD